MTSLLKQLDALASDKRLALLNVLSRSPDLLATSALASLCDMTVSLASRHLAKLAEVGFIVTSSSGQYSLHAAKPDVADEFLKQLASVIRKDAHDESLRPQTLPDENPPLGTAG